MVCEGETTKTIQDPDKTLNSEHISKEIESSLQKKEENKSEEEEEEEKAQ